MPVGRPSWRLRDEVSTAAVCAALAVAWWRLPAFVPRPGGDYGWITGMHALRAGGLSHGTDVVFPYGPLAWLAVPSSLSRVEIAGALALWFALTVGFLVTLQVSLRAVVGAPAAWLATAAVAATFAIELSAPPGSVVTMALVASVLYVTRTLPAGARAVFPGVVGVVAAAFVLTKFTSGLAVGLCGGAAIVSLAERRVWRLAVAALSGALALVGLWAASTHDLQHLPTYLAYSLQLANGYPAAMGIEWPGQEYEYAIAALLGVGLLGALVRPGTPVGPWPFRLAVVVVIWASFRQGFVRHDAHSVHFFATAAGLCVVLAALQRSAVLGVLGGVALLGQAMSMGGGIGYLDPARGLRDVAQAAALLADRGYQRRVNEGARADLRRAARLPEHLVREVAGRTVDVEPFDDHLTWAFGWAWRPLATVQGYTAYTAPLDELNVRALRDDATAPQRILRPASRMTLDGRHVLWDPPRTQLAILCRYRVVAHAEGWELLARGADRCGARRRIGGGRYAANQRVDLPSVHDGIVLATIHPDPSLTRTLAGMFFKTRELHVKLDGTRWRLPWGHTGAPLIVSVPEMPGFAPTPVPPGGRWARFPFPATIELEVVPVSPD